MEIQAKTRKPAKSSQHVLRYTTLAVCVSLTMTGQAQTSPSSATSSADKSNGLAEVVVTAQKRKQNLQKTALSVSSVGGEKIAEQGLTNAAAALQEVPNVVVQGAARGQMLAIRGLGSDLPSGIGESAVSTNYDNVYSYRAEGGVTGFYDMDRIEVLRGPQSTLYGRNATGGVVNYFTANPTFDKVKGSTTAEIGNLNLKRVETALNIPISDKWAARLAYSNIDRKGYSSNGGNDAVGDGARAKLLYKDGDDVSILLGYERSTQGGKGTQNTPVEYWSAGQYYQNGKLSTVSQDFESQKYYADINVKVGPGTLTFIPSYQHAQGYVCDDMSMSDPHSLTCGDDPLKADQKSIDLRYSSLADSSVQWVAGLFYYSLLNDIKFDDIVGSNKTKSLAVYGQVTYPLTEQLRFTAGLRSGKDEKSDEGPVSSSRPQALYSREYKSVDYKLGLEYDVNATSLAYATLGSGHRPGGFNSFPGAYDFFKSENLTALEFGSKNRFENGKYQLNGNVFYYDYKDYQLADFYQATPTSFPRLFINNVPKVRNLGLEIEGKAKVTPNTTLNAAVTLLSTTYQSSYIVHGTGPGVPDVDLKGAYLPHAPKYSVKAGVEHVFDFDSGSSLTGKFNANFVGDQWAGVYPADDQFQKAYVQADASLTYRSADDSWSLNLYGRNLTNKVVKMFYAAGELVPGTPRMYGVTLTVKY